MYSLAFGLLVACSAVLAAPYPGPQPGAAPNAVPQPQPRASALQASAGPNANYYGFGGFGGYGFPAYYGGYGCEYPIVEEVLYEPFGYGYGFGGYPYGGRLGRF